MRIAGRCGYCHKTVRDKPILGTLHICLTPEEIARIEAERRQARHMVDAQRRAMSQPSLYFSGLYGLAGKPRKRVQWPREQWVVT